MTRFDSARVKLDRFDSHFQELEGSIENFFSRASAVARVNKSKSNSGFIHFDLLLTEPVPQKWIAVIGDAIHNARTALDHISYDVAVPNGGDGKKTMFPFVLYRDELDETIKRYTLDVASAEDLVAIKESRPWKRGNTTLWRLHELDIIDKHRGLLPCLGSLNVQGAGGVSAPLHKFHPEDSLGGIAGRPDQIQDLGLNVEKDNPINFGIMLPPSEGGDLGSIDALTELKQIKESVVLLLEKLGQ